MIELNKIYCEDCLVTMSRMPDNFIDCCVTSPPYYGLRDYGHPDQIGLEETSGKYVEKLVKVFAEVKRVLKLEGTLWLNLGDTYSSWKDCKSVPDTLRVGGKSEPANIIEKGKSHSRNTKMLKSQGLKNKDLIGIPWMVAFALRVNGWYLRQDIIWHKPNPMPESVKDRCTKSHEYIFLMSKSANYYYDQESIYEKAIGNDPYIRNKHSVWAVTTKPFSKAHFATFPEDLIIPCIKAGCPEGGIVYDPFMGAGTTALVSHKLNCNWIGSEISPEYCKIAEKRIKPYLMQKNIKF